MLSEESGGAGVPSCDIHPSSLKSALFIWVVAITRWRAVMGRGDLHLPFADIIILLYCVIICFLQCLFCCSAMLRCGGFNFSVPERVSLEVTESKDLCVWGGCFVYHTKWEFLPIQIFPSPFLDVLPLKNIFLCCFFHYILVSAFVNGPCQGLLVLPALPTSTGLPITALTAMGPSERVPDPLNSILTLWVCPWASEQVPDPLIAVLAPALSLLPGVHKAGHCHWTWLQSAGKSSGISWSRLFSWVLNSPREEAPQGLWGICSNVRALPGQVFPAPPQNVLYCSFCSLPFAPSLGTTGQSVVPSSLLPPIRHLCLLFTGWALLALSFSPSLPCSSPSWTPIVHSYSTWTHFLQLCSGCSSPVQDFAELHGVPHACFSSLPGPSAWQPDPLGYQSPHPACFHLPTALIGLIPSWEPRGDESVPLEWAWLCHPVLIPEGNCRQKNCLRLLWLLCADVRWK